VNEYCITEISLHSKTNAAVATEWNA